MAFSPMEIPTFSLASSLTELPIHEGWLSMHVWNEVLSKTSFPFLSPSLFFPLELEA